MVTYRFDNLIADTYIVEVTIPAGGYASTLNAETRTLTPTMTMTTASCWLWSAQRTGCAATRSRSNRVPTASRKPIITRYLTPTSQMAKRPMPARTARWTLASSFRMPPAPSSHRHHCHGHRPSHRQPHRRNRLHHRDAGRHRRNPDLPCTVEHPIGRDLHQFGGS